MKITSRHSLFVLVASTLSLLGCDSSSGTSSKWSASTYQTQFPGTMDVSYSFLNPVTYDLYGPPPAYTETAIVTPNADFTSIAVDSGTCRVVGKFRSVDETSGARLYDIDSTSADCMATADSYDVSMSYDTDNTITWSKDSLKFWVSGSGTIPNAESSLMLFEFDSL